MNAGHSFSVRHVRIFLTWERKKKESSSVRFLFSFPHVNLKWPPTSSFSEESLKGEFKNGHHVVFSLAMVSQSAILLEYTTEEYLFDSPRNKNWTLNIKDKKNSTFENGSNTSITTIKPISKIGYRYGLKSNKKTLSDSFDFLLLGSHVASVDVGWMLVSHREMISNSISMFNDIQK